MARARSHVVSLVCACVLMVVAVEGSRGPFTISKQQEGLGDAPRVTLSQGTVVGTLGESLHHRQFFAFKGIPYALPPVAHLRFRPPCPIPDGNAIINATVEGPECVQKNYLLPTPVLSGQEDCLYLNVYTPKIDRKANLPVMVYIHGGGWFTGSGTSYILGPQHLMDKDVVLVTFNYRLGALGFLSTGEKNATGNYGMKDQVEVLRWVKKNIQAFGGDKDLVTIFGQSAGGASVHYHMVSPLSRGLFHRAISQSGTIMSAWAWPEDALSVARRQAEFVGCKPKQSTTTQMTECLRNIDAHTLVESGKHFHMWSIDPLTTFRPVVEQEGPNAFLTENPLDMVREGKFARVPWMVGVVAQEGIIRGVPIVSNDELRMELSSKWNDLGPFLFELSKSVPKDQEMDLWSNITKFYFNDNFDLNPDNALAFIDMYSDRGFIHGTHKSVLLHSSNGHDNLFFYYFNYRPQEKKVSYQYAFEPKNNRSYGVSHCDDLLYIFHTPALFQGWPSQPHDLLVVKTLITLWTNFAKYGNPTPTNGTTAHLSCIVGKDQCHLNDLRWKPMPVDVLATHTTYLSIYNSTSGGQPSLELSMQEGLLKKRMDFWDSSPLIENMGGSNPHTGQA